MSHGWWKTKGSRGVQSITCEMKRRCRGIVAVVNS